MIANVYLQKRSFLHRMDPRSKMLLLAGVGVVSLLPIELTSAAVLAVSLFIVSAVALGPGEALRPIRAMLTVLVILVLLTPLFYRSGTAILSVRGFTLLTDYGLETTIRYLCRLTGIAEAFYLLFRSTEMEELVASAGWFGLPFTAGLAIGVAMRLIPSTAALYSGVLEAHSLRRPEPGAARRRTVGRIRRLLPAVVAVLVHSVRSIPTLSMALETRGVGRSGRRTSIFRLDPVPRMLLHLLLGGAVLALPAVAVALL